MRDHIGLTVVFCLVIGLAFMGCGSPGADKEEAPKELLIYCGITMIKPVAEIAARIESREDCRIIVTKGLPLVTGILADTVEQITEVAVEDIQPLPVTVEDERTRLMQGQIRVDHRVVFLLDMGRLFGAISR